MILALRQHWPEYLMEALGLGLFMVSAGLFGTLLEAPGSPLRQTITDPFLRRSLMGVAMGLTAVGLIYSPWGRRSGAHINPAVTLTFLRLGKVAPWDACFYIVAQILGGTAGVLLVGLLVRQAFWEPPVRAVVTVPGGAGATAAFAAELVISFGLMTAVLWTSNSQRLTRYTGLFAGSLVALYIAVEAPFSGMSMNPARTVASAWPTAVWTDWWIYFTAPVAGMLLAAEIHGRARRRVYCAKLNHGGRSRCIFRCRYDEIYRHRHEVLGERT